MALIASHFNAGVILVVDSVAIGIIRTSLFPHLHTPFPLLPVPYKPYGFCRC